MGAIVTRYERTAENADASQNAQKHGHDDGHASGPEAGVGQKAAEANFLDRVQMAYEQDACYLNADFTSHTQQRDGLWWQVALHVPLNNMFNWEQYNPPMCRYGGRGEGGGAKMTLEA